MPDKIIAIADDGSCSQKALRPYPAISSPTGSLSITPVVGADGRITYQVEALIDVNLDNATLDPTTLILTLTDTDGSAETVDLSKLRSLLTNTVTGHRIGTHNNGVTLVDINETITALIAGGTGLQFTDEAGVVSTIPACSILDNIPDSTDLIGG